MGSLQEGGSLSFGGLEPEVTSGPLDQFAVEVESQTCSHDLDRRLHKPLLLGLIMVGLLLGLLTLPRLGTAFAQQNSVSSRQKSGQQPPQSVVDVRCAKHLEASPHYDRVVFEINGTTPNFLVIQYVKQLLAQGSGRVIPVAGKNILLVTFSSAHIFQDGKQTVPT